MKAAEIITLKTEVSQIGSVFFTEKLDINGFFTRYNPRKNGLISEENITKRESLLKFLNNLNEISYRDKLEMLSKISGHI